MIGDAIIDRFPHCGKSDISVRSPENMVTIFAVYLPLYEIIKLFLRLHQNNVAFHSVSIRVFKRVYSSSEFIIYVVHNRLPNRYASDNIAVVSRRYSVARLTVYLPFDKIVIVFSRSVKYNLSAFHIINVRVRRIVDAPVQIIDDRIIDGAPHRINNVDLLRTHYISRTVCPLNFSVRR